MGEQPADSTPPERRVRLGEPPVDLEKGWGGTGPRSPSKRLWMRGGVILLPVVAGIIWLGMTVDRPSRSDESDALGGAHLKEFRAALRDEENSEPFQEAAVAAEQVAQRFLGKTDSQQRLAMVREPDVIAGHLPNYSEEARSGTPKKITLLGVSEGIHDRKASFVVEFEGGRFRLLSVLETEDGWKVDWPSYARFCSASWGDLLSGRISKATVRVFVSPGDHHLPPFEDAGKWTCFQLTSPDLPRRVFAYADAGALRSERMKTLVLSSPKYRQHMTLEISPREGPDGQPLFEIMRVLAVGWVRGARDVEEEWLAADGEDQSQK